MNKRTVFITGATSGIGKATAELLAQGPFRLILCGRRIDRLKEICEKLSNQTEVYYCAFDVKDQNAVQKAIDALPEDWQQIDILINNAGNAHGLSPIHEGSLKDWDNMIDINVKGLLYVTKCIAPQMVERKSGHIINIGSTAGKEVYPKGNAYCASKHAVDALNNGMRMDLNPYGIKVSQVCPGLVETEFSMVRFKGDQERAKSVYEGFEALKPEDIAEIIEFILSRPAHVNIGDVITLPTAQASSTIVNRESK